jgi:2-aminoadipate transaminase
MTPPTTPSLSPQLARWARDMERSTIQDMLAILSRPEVLSLALGLPAAELFPTAQVGEAIAQVLASDPRALQYEAPIRRLKSQIVALMARRGVTCAEDEVFLTAGAQQGMSLVSRLLVDPGASVVVEDLTYSGFLQAIAPFEPTLLTVPSSSESGIDVEAVERRIAEASPRPRLIYAISDGHNPLGVSMSLESRRRLVEIARAHRVPILEDDAYGFLSYDEAPRPPLRALEDRWVIYLGSFSKILAPALRAGWVIVPRELIGPLSVIKESSDIDTCTLAHRCISQLLSTGMLDGHLALLRDAYRARRDAMLAALKDHFPGEARWFTPAAGMFVWVELPEHVDTMRLLEAALETERVAFLPGQAFWVKGGPRPRHGMRLNFSNCAPERITEGVLRLGRALASLRG